MKKFDKMLVLENDIQHQGLPDHLQDIIDINKKPADIWWWFGEDVRQNTAKSFKRFAEAAADPGMLVISNPSGTATLSRESCGSS